MRVLRDPVSVVTFVHNTFRARLRMVCTGTPRVLLMLAFIGACTLMARVSPADPEIVSFHHGGELVWSNAHDSAAYRVEWAPSPTGVWRSTWQPLQFVVSPQPGLVTSAVPMFYRVVQTSTSPPADNTFVAAGGVISNTDIRVASSIQDGISQAVAGGRSVVAVSVGRYEQRVALAPGVHVRGGYSADFTEWDPVLYPTVIAPPSSPGAQVAVVTARDINVSAGLHDCVIEVPAAVDGNALGVLVVDCDESLEIRGNTIQGGVAPDGADGEDERNGPNGMPGTDGLWEVIFDPSTPITRAPGVGGVLSWMSQDLSGGNGGPSTNALYNLPQASGGNGRGPVVATGGTGGSGADWFNQDVLWILIEPTSGVLDGASGTNGTNGADGGAGSGGNGYGSFSPSLSGFIWVSHSGAAGGNGVNGSGGGGGGASGGCVGPLTD